MGARHELCAHMEGLSMNFMKIFISAYTRIVLGITCLTTLAWFMWPESEFKIQAEPLSALVIAILTWLGSEISAQVLNSSLSQHDTNLLEKLDRIISDDFRSFIKVHDFGAPFAHSSIYPISKLADDWTGSRNEFVDKELGDKFKKILDLSHQIRSTILSQAGPAAKKYEYTHI